MLDAALIRQLQQDATALGLNLSETEQQKLLVLLQQLLKWNKAYNLTAITEPGQALTLHIIDSLSVLPWIGDGPVLDIGTGAGFPGLPLAIMKPHTRFVLLDSNGKKIRFIRQICHQLQLDNVEARHQRIEDHRATYPQVISRAFAALRDFIRVSEHTLNFDGEWLAMKSQRLEEEKAALDESVQLIDIHALNLPRLSATRYLVRCQRAKVAK